MTSSDYSLTSAIGSIVNIFQTGWLFNKLIQWNVSIPVISSSAGIAGGREFTQKAHSLFLDNLIHSYSEILFTLS